MREFPVGTNDASNGERKQSPAHSPSDLARRRGERWPPSRRPTTSSASHERPGVRRTLTVSHQCACRDFLPPRIKPSGLSTTRPQRAIYLRAVCWATHPMQPAMFPTELRRPVAFAPLHALCNIGHKVMGALSLSESLRASLRRTRHQRAGRSSPVSRVGKAPCYLSSKGSNPRGLVGWRSAHVGVPDTPRLARGGKVEPETAPARETPNPSAPEPSRPQLAIDLGRLQQRS